MHFRRKFPSLTALVALEAAARHRSISLAAKELGVTQAAVSRHIALLEGEFGRPLFVRAHRAIIPTPECILLGRDLAAHFYGIADAVETMRAKATHLVTIGATIAFSSLWLTPRLAEFRRAHPGLQIRVISGDETLDLTSGAADIDIRFGTPPFRDGTSLAQRKDAIFPVCAPDYLTRNDLSAFPDCRVDLIEHDVPDRSWYRWTDWFAQTGTKPREKTPAMRFSYFNDAVSAALGGEGVILGWKMLVGKYLQAGDLVPVGDVVLEPEHSYNIVVPAEGRASPQAELVRAWLVEALLQP
jgi:DNA-binding transcriptional LysR family regulator